MLNFQFDLKKKKILVSYNPCMVFCCLFLLERMLNVGTQYYWKQLYTAEKKQTKDTEMLKYMFSSSRDTKSWSVSFDWRKHRRQNNNVPVSR